MIVIDFIVTILVFAMGACGVWVLGQMAFQLWNDHDDPDD